MPAAGAPVTVSVAASDPSGVASATLRYAVNGGAWQSTPMNAVGGKFSANIPGQSASAIVQFYVEATDTLAATATAPASGAASRALYKVQDGLADLSTLHNVRIVMTPADAAALHANANLMSNGTLGATIITDESDICYDAGVHLRGSTYGRPYDEFVGYSVRFPADHPFRGAHQRVVIDRSGRGPFGSPSPDEILVKHMADHGCPRAGANVVTVQARDFQGAQVGTDSITITSTLSAPLARDFLRVTELHYHPAAPVGAELNVSADKDDFEFIELRNIGSQLLDIGGCAFTSGVEFLFPASTALADGESIVVVRNAAAFQARYGVGVRIAGVYGPGSSLNNGGETLTLLDATGALIQSFAWDDAWFPATDGPGRSLVVRSESAAVSAWNGAAQWGISPSPGGTPGTVNSGAVAWQFEGWRQTYFSAAELAAPLISSATAGAGGVTNGLRYALGLTPFEPAPALLTGTTGGGALAAVYRRRQNLLDAEFTVEGAGDLTTWTPLVAPVITTIDNGDGTETVTVRDTVPLQGNGQRFLRLRIALQAGP